MFLLEIGARLASLRGRLPNFRIINKFASLFFCSYLGKKIESFVNIGENEFIEQGRIEVRRFSEVKRVDTTYTFTSII
jgi:hypothetical protein